jgi:subtilisin family serine protease
MLQNTGRALRSYTTTPITILMVFGVVFFMLHLSQPLHAQDGTDLAPTAEQPLATEVVTQAAEPTLAPTEATTQPPTEAQPVTESPATAAPVTEVPTEATAAATSEAPVVVIPATPIVAAPVFNFTHGTQFDATAGTPLTMQVLLTHNTPMVAVTTSAVQGIAAVTTAAPAEASAPFNSLVSITYTAAIEFSGIDTLVVTAADGSGQTTSVALTLNVRPAVVPTAAPTVAAPATKELLITYNPSASEATIQAMLTGLGAVEISRIPQIGAMRVLVPEAQALPTAAMATLQSTNSITLAGVTSVEANGSYQLFAYTPNDPGFGLQWGLTQGTGGIFAQYAWDIATTRGLGVTIAVIDGGVDLQHPDLVNQLVPGWDFVKDDSSPDNYDINDPLDPLDDAFDNGHGTHVAGIIAAKTGNSIGTAGIAFNAKIMPLRACDVALQCNAYYVAGAIVHAVDKGAKVINLSFGSKINYSTVEAAVNYALSKNVVVVAAAGNIGLVPGGQQIADGDLVYPASYPGVISVAAYDDTGTRSSVSNSNNMVDISAPGVNIHSLLPVETNSSKYGTMSGTSMSSAYVSGVAALIVGAKVAITPATVLDALTCGAQDAGSPGFDNVYGHGRLQADISLNWNLNSKGCKVTLANDSLQTPALIAAAPYLSTLPIHSRTATAHASDPSPLCSVSPTQTLWYTFKPTISGYYQLSTLGSSYDTVFAIYQGGVGQLSAVGCSTTSQQAFSLQATQTYYIVVGTEGTAVDDQVLQLRLNAALPTNNLLYQENAPNIAYSGMWMRGVVTGSSGGYTQQTTDLSASAAFSFRGLSFDYVRTLGPAQGQVLIYINNDPTPIAVDNRGAVLKANQIKKVFVPNGSAGQWNTVRIVRDASIPGSIDVDAIKTYDFDNTILLAPITTKVDDRATTLSYVTGTTNNWTPAQLATAFAGTLKQTDDPTAKVTFRITGNALTIFRMTGPGNAPMQVVIDNGAPITVDNTSATNVVRPYTIDNLVTMPHVVEIRKIGTVGDGLLLQLDAVQGQTLANLLAGTIYDERSPYIAYRGIWTDTASVPGANALTTRTLTAGTEASFKFTGNDLCIGYRQSSGTLDVYIDGTFMSTIPGSGGNAFVKWCLDANANTLVADSTHYARLVVPAANTFILDSVRPQRYNTITPARALVPETDLSFRYSATTDWLTQTTKSLGGYLPQGGSLRGTSVDNTTVTFYINGSGFILYTMVGPDRGCWEVFIDGVLYQPEPGANSINLLDNLRYRPLGYGIVGLTPGIHKVVLRADTNVSSIGGNTPGFIVNFDGVRVFP